MNRYKTMDKKRHKGGKRLLASGLGIALVLTSLIPPSGASAAQKAVKISKSSFTLKSGTKGKLRLKNVDQKKRTKIKWTTSDKKIVTVSVNKTDRSVATVKAGKKGKATVTADLSGRKYKCRVTVKNSEAAKTSKPAEPSGTSTVSTPQVIYVEVMPTITPQIIYVEATPAPAGETPLPETGEETPVPEGTTEADGTFSPAPSVTGTPEAGEETPLPTGETSLPDAPKGNLTYQSDVTAEMTQASYWTGLCEDPDEVLASAEEIEQINQDILAKKETNTNDLLNSSETFPATARKEALAAALISEVKEGRADGKTLYLDGVEVEDKDAFFAPMYDNIISAQTEDQEQVKYALCTKSVEMKMAPIDGFVGFSATDTDDEFVDSRLNVNEPLIVEAVTADGAYYWGKTVNCSGWVKADHMAICDSRDEWISMWTGKGEDILVVATDQIILAPSAYTKEISKTELHLGTVLPLVPEEEIPEKIDGRGRWYNYVVYVPTRDADGKFVRSMALISMNQDVSIGYLPCTQANILKVAFRCLGDRYGWGGMMDLMDCSLYVRDIYRCFGFELPRNTTWQVETPTDNVDLSGMADEEKRNVIDTLEPGTLFMLTGHIMMYIGSAGGRQYVISDMGSVAETEDVSKDAEVKSIFCVGINSLDVRRRNGNTWLSELKWAVRPWSGIESE